MLSTVVSDGEDTADEGPMPSPPRSGGGGGLERRASMGARSSHSSSQQGGGGGGGVNNSSFGASSSGGGGAHVKGVWATLEDCPYDRYRPGRQFKLWAEPSPHAVASSSGGRHSPNCGSTSPVPPPLSSSAASPSSPRPAAKAAVSPNSSSTVAATAPSPLSLSSSSSSPTAYVTWPSDHVICTRALQRQQRLIHCTHFWKNGLCKLGYRCNFVHAIALPPQEGNVDINNTTTNNGSTASPSDGRAAPNGADLSPRAGSPQQHHVRDEHLMTAAGVTVTLSPAVRHRAYSAIVGGSQHQAAVAQAQQYLRRHHADPFASAAAAAGVSRFLNRTPPMGPLAPNAAAAVASATAVPSLRRTSSAPLMTPSHLTVPLQDNLFLTEGSWSFVSPPASPGMGAANATFSEPPTPPRSLSPTNTSFDTSPSLTPAPPPLAHLLGMQYLSSSGLQQQQQQQQQSYSSYYGQSPSSHSPVPPLQQRQRAYSSGSMSTPVPYYPPHQSHQHLYQQQQLQGGGGGGGGGAGGGTGGSLGSSMGGGMGGSATDLTAAVPTRPHGGGGRPRTFSTASTDSATSSIGRRNDPYTVQLFQHVRGAVPSPL